MIVHCKSASHHVDVLRQYLARLTEYNLRLSPKKAHIGAPEVQFRAHLVTPSGLRPGHKKIDAMLKIASGPQKIDAMLKMSMPSTKGELCSLLGSVSYLRKKSPGLSTTVKNLHSLLRKDVRFEFAAHHATIAKKILNQLVSSEFLAFPDY